MALRRTVLASFAAVAAWSALVAAPAAHAASPARSLVYDVPSTKGNIDVSKVNFNDDTKKLTAWVRLPAGYDDQPDRRWPVLYLLHGWEDSSNAWLDPKKGSIDTVLPADFNGIVVMPEGGKEWFVNWADPAKNPGHQWEDYLLDEVVPFMESHLRILPGRANHAIGGLSMGGFGGLRAVATMPTYFGQAVVYSGLVNTQDPSFQTILNIAQIPRPGYGAVFGTLTGAYATTLNPIKYARDFSGSNISLYYGTPSIAFLWSTDVRVHGVATLEIGVGLETRDLLAALKPTTANVFSMNLAGGQHDWPWWRQYLANSVQRGLWNAPPITQTSQATSWTYDTMATHGNAWGLGFKMQTAPVGTVTLQRSGSTLTGTGKGTIQITGGAADDDDSGNGTLAGCSYTLTLPFKQQLPAGC
ncbi:MAG: alpha/beta hydrolase-fold protein [Solirubrobacteraceae bacterium]|nr:alpha/beta hydrolase-fold protein [Patulibacter sp.]